MMKDPRRTVSSYARVVAARVPLIGLVVGVMLLTALGVLAGPVEPAGAQSLTWSVLASPNVLDASGSATSDSLDGISCTSATNCVTVGSALAASGVSSQTLVESWNGTSWSVVPSPNVNTTNVLLGVSCTSATNCMAVGYSEENSTTPFVDSTLAETWNGTSWSVVPSPSPGTQGDHLAGVTCLAANDCIAVGYSENSSTVYQTLVESWDGTTWSIVPSPNVASVDNSLVGVSCTDSTDCVAVGNTVDFASLTISALAEIWNGTSWSITPSANIESGIATLGSVSCTSSISCVAVGLYNNATTSNAQNPLVESWNGTTWSVVPSPSVSTSASSTAALTGVSCPAANDCVAVGRGGSTTGLIETWDGSTWSINPSPTIPAGEFLGMSCTSSTACIAVGSFSTTSSNNNPVDQTLVETTGAAPPYVVTQPTNQSSAAGGTVSFTAAAIGNPSPTVQWQVSTDGGSTWSDVSGATASTYSITGVLSSDNGNEFRAVFTNTNGSVTTNAASLTVVPPPTTSVLLPSNGATVSGDTWLDAAASSPVGVASVTFEVSGGSVFDQVVGTGTPTLYGWIGGWDTTDVPNGTYTLQSVATDSLGQSTSSAGITVTVDNLPLHTAVIIPSGGTTLSGSSAVLDALASGTSDVTGVQYELSGGSLSNQVIATGTATIWGWLAVWNSTSVPNGTYTLQSVATEVGGTTATSPGITVTVSN